MTLRALVLCLGLLGHPAVAQEAELGLALREVMVVDLESPARFGGEGGPIVSSVLLLVAESTDDEPPLAPRGAPESTFYVDDSAARLVSFDAKTAVLAVPMPAAPGEAVLWRLDVSDLVKGGPEQKSIPAVALASPGTAKELAAMARRKARPAIAIGPRLDTARREKIAADDLLSLSEKLRKGN